MDIKNKTAVVTGGAVRIGRAISLALAARGAQVVVAYHSSETQARALVSEIEREHETRAIAVRCDVSQAKDVQALFEKVDAEFGALDVLVNNAAVFSKRAMEDLTETDFDFAIDVNLKGSYLCALEAGRRMLKQEAGGKIVQIADVAGRVAWKNYAPYCISKAGALMLVKCLAKEFAPRVQVNAVAPGAILLAEGETEADIKHIVARNVIKRLGAPEDVTRAVLFLTEASDYITGETIFVDGGRHLA
jgi:NAD(P)-dependent dehydrogenase (short-subunit alcohol dehydrogenase family)